MSQTNMQNDMNDEILDVKPLVNLIRFFFRGSLKLLFNVLSFYKRKAILFIFLIIVGVVGGYFLGKLLRTDKVYTQEVVLQPKYEVESYMYDFLGKINQNLKDTVFLKKIGLTNQEAKNLKRVAMEPVVQATDILDEVFIKYDQQESFYKILDEYDEDELRSSKYRNLYKYHKVVFYFRSNALTNTKISLKVLDYIATNGHYNELLLLKQNQTKSTLDKNLKTLQFINNYLEKLTENSSINESKEIVVFANESDIPTVSSLLERKDQLLNVINAQEQALILDKKLFKIVQNGNITTSKVKTYKQLFFVLPLLFFSIMSLIFLLKYFVKLQD